MKNKLRILMLEDNQADAEIITELLSDAIPGCQFKVVTGRALYITALTEFKPDVILSDNSIPQITAAEALEFKKGLKLGIPFIMVSGTSSKAFEAFMIGKGADDYVLKDKITRLPGAIESALKQKKIGREKLEAEGNDEASKSLKTTFEATLKELRDYKIALDESFIISITNRKGIITYVNRNFCEISKYTADEVLGKNHSIVNSSFYDRAFFKQLWNTILAGKIWRHEIKNKAKDGEMFWVDATIIPFLDNKGNPVEFVAINRDITEKKAIEKELFNQKVQEQKKITRAILIAGEKERNRLSRELHDNINQLLAGIKLYLGIAARDNPEFREKIKYAMELLDHSMEELRSLSHRMGAPLNDINLRSMIENLLATISQGSTIETHLEYSISSPVLADDLKLNIFRIVQEQTHNILKYAHAKNIDIRLTEKDGMLNIIIKDDGEGFDINAIRRGIGISNIKHRVTSFNGQMEIISSPGNGCTIVLKIPTGQL